MTLRVQVHGAGGRMGAVVTAAIAKEPDLQLVAATGRADDLGGTLRAQQPQVLVEFTTPDHVYEHVRTALLAGVHVVSGTTGLAPARQKELGQLATERKLGCLLAPNFALGMLLLQRFAVQAARYFPDVEIVEMHHDQKHDAPSGTAIATARRIGAVLTPKSASTRAPGVELVPHVRGGREAGVPIHSIRLPGLLAHQEVLLGGPGQVLTLRHDALDRRAYVPGVLLAIRRIQQRTGLLDSLDALLDD